MAEVFIVYGSNGVTGETWDIAACLTRPEAIETAQALNALVFSLPRFGPARVGNRHERAAVCEALGWAGDPKCGGSDVGFANYGFRALPLPEPAAPRGPETHPEIASLELRFLKLLQRPAVTLHSWYGAQPLQMAMSGLVEKGWAFREASKGNRTRSYWLTPEGRVAFLALEEAEKGVAAPCSTPLPWGRWIAAAIALVFIFGMLYFQAVTGAF